VLINLYDTEVPADGEIFQTLLHAKHLRIELIVSSEEPEERLYDQPHDEAVLLLDGCASLWIDGRVVALQPGDFLLIPARTPHKVIRTDPGTRWLAIHSEEKLC